MAGVIGALACAEIGLRLVEPFSIDLARLLHLPNVTTSYDALATTAELLAESGFGYHPHGATPGFTLNSRGFRTHEYEMQPGEDVFRIVALGDSFTFDSHGVPIEQMWHQRAAADLEARLARPVEAISLSAPGVGPAFSLRLWELEGRTLSPHLVVFALFVGNDFSDETSLSVVRDAGPLARWSLLVRLLRNRGRLRHLLPAHDATEPPGTATTAHRAAAGREAPGYESTYDPTRPTFEREAFLRIERERVAIFAGAQRDSFAHLFDRVAMIIERMARQVELSGSAFVVMIIPDEAQVDDELWAEILARFPDPQLMERDRPQKWLHSFLQERDIPHVDLLQSFREAHGQLYKPQDTHWTSRGNSVAAAALVRHVIAERKIGLAGRGS